MTGLILPQATSATSVATAEMPLPDAETVFRTLAAATGPHLKRLPDGETGFCSKCWPIEVASDVPPFKFTQ